MEATLDALPQEKTSCPLCGYGFTPSKACSSGCPMGEGCGMVKCPNCRYEFVEKSQVAEGLKKLFHKLFGQKKKESP